MKKKMFLILLVILQVLNLISYDEEKSIEQPEFRKTIITLLLEEGYPYNANIQGTLLEKQWNGAPEKIKETLENKYKNSTGPQKSFFIVVFENNNVLIIVEDTKEYSYYKTIGEKTTFYLNINALENGSKIFNALDALVYERIEKE